MSLRRSVLLLLPFALFTFVGCGAHANATAVRGPDGAEGWYVVRCENARDCTSAEASVCPRGYDVADDFERHEVETARAASHEQTLDGKLIHCRMTEGSMY